MASGPHDSIWLVWRVGEPPSRLDDASATGADFNTADLRNASIVGVDLSGANLSLTDMRHADVRHTSLAGADLSHAVLAGQRYHCVDFTGANLSGADCTGTTFTNCTFTDAQMNGTAVEPVAHFQMIQGGARLDGPAQLAVPAAASPSAPPPVAVGPKP